MNSTVRIGQPAPHFDLECTPAVNYPTLARARL